MILKVVLYFGFIFLLLTGVTSASSQYGSINAYYNDQVLPGKEIAKPTLKIKEPFNIKIEMTLNQTSTLFFKVCSLGGDYFKVIDGPSEFEKTKYMKSLNPGKYTFEWTLVPTNQWAGGSIPVNFWYQINLPGQDEPVVNGEFTVAYCTISNEYYEGKNSNSQDQSIKEVESPSETKPPSESAKVPAFTIASAVSVLALIFFLNRR